MSSKKQISLSCSKSLIFRCWILWTLLEEQQVLIPSWKQTKLQGQKDSSATNSLITTIKCRRQKFSQMILSTANFAAVTLLKPNKRTMLTYRKVDWPQQAVIELKLSKPPPTGIENYQYLQQIWKQEQKSSFKEFLWWYNKKKCCANFGGNAKNDCLLPRQRYQYVEVWLYFTKLG